MAATTNGPSMVLPSRRNPMRAPVHSLIGVAPLLRLVVRRVRTDVAPLFRLAVRRVRTGDLLRSCVVGTDKANDLDHFAK